MSVTLIFYKNLLKVFAYEKQLWSEYDKEIVRFFMGKMEVCRK